MTTPTRTAQSTQPPKEFTAAVVEEFGPNVTVRAEKFPEPGEHQALVKLEASGICHTDLHAAEGDWPVKPDHRLSPDTRE